MFFLQVEQGAERCHGIHGPELNEPRGKPLLGGCMQAPAAG